MKYKKRMQHIVGIIPELSLLQSKIILTEAKIESTDIEKANFCNATFTEETELSKCD